MVLSGLFQLKDIGAGDGPGLAPTVVATLVSFAVGYASIAWLLRWLTSHTTLVFVVYRVALGLLLGGGAALSGMAVGMETHYAWLGTVISVFGIILAVTISLLLVLPLVMSVWLAPPLAVFHDIPAMTAMKQSFLASWRSLPAFIVAFFLVALMLFLTSLTLGLALLVVIPVMAGATYAAYRDLFELPQAMAESAPAAPSTTSEPSSETSHG